MKRNTLHCAAALALLCAGARTSHAQEPPTPQDFSTGDGAYYTTLGGKEVDPYFVNKGFIIALQADAPVREELLQWMHWLLPRQRADGGFDRYCRDTANRWNSCQKADADDSMAATTMQMLALAQQKNWLTSSERKAAREATVRARRLLDSLLSPDRRIYRVFPDTELYYLMDNAEVHEGLTAVGATREAAALARNMHRQFRVQGSWTPSIPPYSKPQFYPHTLASAYLWGTRVISSRESSSAMAAWLAQNGSTWLSRTDDPYAWGLIAWQLREQAPIQASCWRASIRPYATRVGWTVLDAFIDRSLQHLGIGSDCPWQASPGAGDGK